MRHTATVYISKYRVGAGGSRIHFHHVSLLRIYRVRQPFTTGRRSYIGLPAPEFMWDLRDRISIESPASDFLWDLRDRYPIEPAASPHLARGSTLHPSLQRGNWHQVHFRRPCKLAICFAPGYHAGRKYKNHFRFYSSEASF